MTSSTDPHHDAPRFTRFLDSVGNESRPVSTEACIDWTAQALRVGDILRLSTEVGGGLPPEEYDVCWTVNIPNGEQGDGPTFDLILQPHHGSSSLSISCTVRSRRLWLRHGTFDAHCWISYEVQAAY